MRLRTLLAAAAIAGVAASPIHLATQSTASNIPRLEAPMQRLTVGQDQHSAFPGMTCEPSGVLRLVWRQGSKHVSPDGRIVTAESWDDGTTWTNPQTLRANPDYRDPSISNIDGIEYLTWFGSMPGNEALGAAVMRAWNVEGRRIDPSYPRAAITAPVVKLPDGRLGTAFYAKQPGESLYQSYMAWSSDNGWTWTSNRIVNLASQGLSTTEPYLVVNGASVHMLYRWGDTALGIRSSNDSGATWDTPRVVRYDATGRPSTIAAAGGRLVMVYRDLPGKNARMAYSLDNGWSWYDAGIVLAAPSGSPNGMTYATMLTSRDDPTELRVVVGMEQADGSSQLWGGTVDLP